MQTFMPMIKPFATASRLRDEDLHLQIRDCTSILRAVCGLEECTSMYMKAWDGYAEALSVFSLAMVHESRINRQHYDEVWQEMAGLVSDYQIYAEEDGKRLVWPPWVGDFDIHRSHRSVLIGRHPYYRTLWPNNPERMPLFYPQPISVDREPKGYRLRISPMDERRLAAGELQLPLHLKYDVNKREVLRVPEFLAGGK